MSNETAHNLLLNAYQMILQAYESMGYPITQDDNFRDTAERAAKAALEIVRPVSEIQAEIDDLIGKTFPARYNNMVISKHNICFGLCPHHLLPVVYRVSLAYLPHDRVVGISKLSRLIRLMARQPILQEDFTHELAELLHTRLASRGSAEAASFPCAALSCGRTYSTRFVFAETKHVNMICASRSGTKNTPTRGDRLSISLAVMIGTSSSVSVRSAACTSPP